ncbi:MAG: 50S ribosomal protein L11 methyltransferase [Chitinispirillaceae bacterium]|nr:50S ribosomal protein L11 methyltransferase [Chitinispirillaceae bacterium]
MATYCFECTVPLDKYEQILAIWYSMGMQGCEENDAGNQVSVKVYFGSKDETLYAMKEFNVAYPGQTLTLTEIEKQDWNAKWRESMQPARLAPGYWVSPLWLPPEMEPDDIWIKIEPKMAFGTGHHETTRLAAAALITHKSHVSGSTIADIGTGSGVLCFVADTLKSSRCIGIEIDNDCRENLAENYQLNNPSGTISFLIGATDALKKSFTADIIVMNMILTESSPLLNWASNSLIPGGLLILSGILVDEFDKAIDLAQQEGCTLLDQTKENEWWCGTFIKNG